MTFQDLANLGDAIGGFGVVISVLYLAVQIRQNTRTMRTTSYHQAAEQTWNYCLAVAGDASLAEILAKRTLGEPVTLAEQYRLNVADQALIYGFENMLRLKEQGLVDPDVWRNFMMNSTFGDAGRWLRATLMARPGPLSKRLLAAVDEFAPPVGDPLTRSAPATPRSAP